MLKIFFLVIAIACNVQCFGINGIAKRDVMPEAPQKLGLPASTDTFSPRTDWSYFHPSWSLPSMPSMSYFFKDDNGEPEKPTEILSKKLNALEKWVKELNDLVKKQANAFKKFENPTTTTTTTARAPVEAPPPTPCPKSTLAKGGHPKEQKPARTTGEQKPDDPAKSAEPKKAEKPSGMADKPSENSQAPKNVDKTKEPVESAPSETPKATMDKKPERAEKPAPSTSPEKKPDIDTRSDAEPEKPEKTSEGADEPSENSKAPENVDKRKEPVEAGPSAEAPQPTQEETLPENSSPATAGQ